MGVECGGDRRECSECGACLKRFNFTRHVKGCSERRLECCSEGRSGGLYGCLVADGSVGEGGRTDGLKTNGRTDV